MILKNKSETSAAFGKFISKGRERSELRQIDVCQKTGMTQAHYSMIEQGKREVTLSAAMNICDALGLDINDFVEIMSK